MRIVIANVNTTVAITDRAVASAAQFASPGTEIIGVTPRFGAASVETHHEAYLATVGVMDALRRHPEPFDAIVLAGFGEPGREGLEELFDVPVLDITECAVHTAYLLGRRYGILTPGPGKIEGPTRDRLRIAGVLDRLVSVRGVGLDILAMEADHGRTRALLRDAARLAVDQDGAEVLILGCAALAGAAQEVQQELGVPVLDGVVLAVRYAETFYRLGIRRARHEKAKEKPMAVWP